MKFSVLFSTVIICLFLASCIDSSVSGTTDVNNEADLQFLEDNAQKEGVIVTESGLQYRVIKEGEGTEVSANSVVRFHFTGKFVNGNTFQSTHTDNQGEPIDYPLPGSLIDGMVEGLMLMREGDIYELVLPPELAYGNNPPQGSNIYPGAVLIFEVELVAVL